MENDAHTFTNIGWQARLIVKRLQNQPPERRTDAETPVRKSQGREDVPKGTQSKLPMKEAPVSGEYRTPANEALKLVEIIAPLMADPGR